MKNKKTFIIIAVFIVIISILTLSIRTIIKSVNSNLKQEELTSFSYETKMFTVNNDYTYTFISLVTVQELEGIDTITYTNEGENEVVVSGNGRQKIAFDFKALENKEYTIKIKPVGQAEKTEKIIIERKVAGKDTYRLINGVYLNIPFLDNFNSDYTRYLSLTSNDTLTPTNWISNEEPNNWYDYKNSKWANVYVEADGVEGYYVWIPRYVYKLNSTNQTSDIKFVDVYNNYIDAETGETSTYKELVEQGYKLPEAFEFGDSNDARNGSLYTSISGYWISKYQLSELTEYKLNYNMSASKNSITINNFINNVSDKSAKYTYSINGELKNTSNSLDKYIFEELDEGKTYIINVTAFDENDGIIGSMTKRIEPVEVNEPNLDGFNPNITFYVIYNEDGTENINIPISEPAPDNWYDYTYANWANIVVKNEYNELTYYTWIPRYQYRLNNTTQRSDVKFILGASTQTTKGYKIPEAFWWDKNDNNQEDDGEQLTGYWITKYQIVDKDRIYPSREPLEYATITADGIVNSRDKNTGELFLTKSITPTNEYSVGYNGYDGDENTRELYTDGNARIMLVDESAIGHKINISGNNNCFIEFKNSSNTRIGNWYSGGTLTIPANTKYISIARESASRLGIQYYFAEITVLKNN